jgi:hypothetical protein
MPTNIAAPEAAAHAIPGSASPRCKKCWRHCKIVQKMAVFDR